MGWGTDEVVGGWGKDEAVGVDMEAIKRRDREIKRESAQQAFQQLPWYQRLPAQAAIGGFKAGADYLSTGVRAASLIPGMPEGMGQFSDDVNTAVAADLSGGVRFLDESVQGASRSLTKAATVNAAGGGLTGIIGEAALTAANQAYTKSRRAGKSHNAALAYATTSGVIEGGITAALPGQSGLVTKNKGLLGGVTGWVKRQLMGIAGELPQEAAIGYAQGAADVGFGVDPNALSPEARNQMARSIIGQTLVAGGAIGAAQAALPADPALIRQEARAAKPADIQSRRAAYTTPENAASVLQSAREAGTAAGLETLAAKEKPTRKDWESAGLPADMGKSGETRAAFASRLKEAMAAEQEQPAAVAPANSPPFTPPVEESARVDVTQSLPPIEIQDNAQPVPVPPVEAPPQAPVTAEQVAATETAPQPEVEEEVTNAEAVRGNARQVPQAGPVQESGPSQGGANLEQQAQAEPGRPASQSLTESPDVLRITPGIPTGGLSKLGAAIKSGFRKFLTSRGNLPQDAFDESLAKNAKVAAELRKMSYTGNSLRDALIQEQGSNKLSAEGQQRVDAALKGDQQSLAALPPKVRLAVGKMRDHIDYLSRRLIDSGMASEKLELTIDENLGTYATRSYQVFDDPKWADKVPVEVRNKAKSFIRAELPNATDQELENMIGDLLYKENAPIALLKQGKLGSKDLSILKRRKNIPPEIRALLGEYKDPLVNYTRSVTKMAHLLANHEFLSQVRKEGLGQYLFEQDDPNRPTGHNAPIASEGSKAMEPLNGLMTTPEIAKAFQEQFADTVRADGLTGELLKWMYRAIGLPKYAKTVGNFPMGYVRNFVANAETLLANGNVPFLTIPGTKEKARKAFGAVSEDVRADLPDFASQWFSTDEKWQKTYENYASLHVVDESVHAGELRDVLKDAQINGPAEATNNALVQVARKGGEAAASLYQSMDNVWRIMHFEAEKAKYKKAFPGWTEQQLDEKAADITRNTFHTYSMIPAAIKTLRRVPFIAPFVSFTAETIRTKSNSLGLAVQELSNPATKEIGAKRLVGNIAAMSLVPAVDAAARFILGITLDDDDDLRRFAPPWSRNADILHLPSGDDPTKRKWVDVSYASPSAYFRRPITALLRGDDWEESFKESVGEAFEPFLGEELLVEKVLDVARNKQSSGAPIYGPADSSAEVAKKSVSHIAEAFTPGTLSVAERNYKAWTDFVEPSGRRYDKATEAIAPITGMRIQDTDVAQGLVFAARRFNATRPDITSLFVKTFSGPGTTSPEQVKATYLDADQKARRHFMEMRETVSAAIRLGLEPDKAYQSLVAGGVSNDLASQVISGHYEPYRVSNTVLERLGGMEDADARYKAYIEAYEQAAGNALD